MAARAPRKTQSLVAKSAELAFAVPQVVAHRMTRMAMAGASPSERDQKEFALMVAEKNDAFNESWSAMAAQALSANQALASSFVKSFWSLSAGRKPSAQAVVAQLQSATLEVLGKGMAPVHRKAVANAKRLARTKLR